MSWPIICVSHFLSALLVYLCTSTSNTFIEKLMTMAMHTKPHKYNQLKCIHWDHYCINKNNTHKAQREANHLQMQCVLISYISRLKLLWIFSVSLKVVMAKQKYNYNQKQFPLLQLQYSVNQKPENVIKKRNGFSRGDLINIIYVNCCIIVT